MYNVMKIAEYVVDRCNTKESAVTNLKLQKMLYFIQAEFLVDNHFPCFEDDFHAWNYGPVVIPVYRKYKVFGSSCIPSFPKNEEYYGIAAFDKKIIDDMIDQCMSYPVSALTEIVQNQKPWKDAYTSEDKLIAKQEIYDYFKE